MQGLLFGPPKHINSVAEYIEAVKNRPGEQDKHIAHPRYVYRGHSDTGYPLQPSIERDDFDASLEARLIEMARNKRPDIFKTDDKLSLLAKIQHYGLPTRLLNFTDNPLVALYFACHNTEKDGEVLEFEEQVYRTGAGLPAYTSLTFIEPWNSEDKDSYRSICEGLINRFFSYDFQKQLILSLVGNVSRVGITVENWHARICNEPWFIEWERMVYRGFLNNELQWKILAALLRSPLLVEAQETLERQRLQQGMYLLIPNEVVEEEGQYVIKPNLPKLNVKNSNIGHMIIKSESKTEILKELDLIGINEGFLFGDSIDHVCAQIKKSII